MESWNHHYKRQKSKLSFPDENLVRMLFPHLKDLDTANLSAIDIGCGSGRHTALLKEAGVGRIIGTDIAYNGTRMTAELSDAIRTVQCDTAFSPFKDNSFDIAVAWGSLHYASLDMGTQQISEIYRILKKGGLLFATLRSDRDTFFDRKKKLSDQSYIVTTADLTESTVTFYNTVQIRELFKEFSSIEIGLMERTQLNSNRRISHHYFRAEK